MAVLLAKTMGQLNEDRKGVHPLFQKSSKATKSDKIPTSLIQQTVGGTKEENLLKSSSIQGSKKLKESAMDDSILRPSSNLLVVTPQQTKLELQEEVDLNNHRRKRQKHDSTDDETAGTEDVPLRARRKKVAINHNKPASFKVEDPAEGSIVASLEIEPEKGSGIQERFQESTKTSLEESAPPLPEAHNPQISANTVSPTLVLHASESTKGPTNYSVDSRPRKILHFNPKTGTIGSPPAKKPSAPIEVTNKSRLNSHAKEPKSKVISICYWQDEISTSTIGLQIDQILNGTKRVKCPIKKKGPSPKKNTSFPSKAVDIPKVVNPESEITGVVTVAPKKLSAPLHPFFSGKPIAKPTDSKDTANADAGLVEPPKDSVSLERTRWASVNKLPTPTRPRSSAYTGFQGFGTGSKLTKFPEAIESAWPWQGMVHIRGNEIHDDRSAVHAQLDIRSRSKKSKYHAIEILAEEDVLVTVTAESSIGDILESIRDMNLDEHPSLPDCLRAPKKHFESGYKLQRRIRKELDARLPQPTANDTDSSEDEVQERGSDHKSAHPALCRAYASIATSLTAFDQFCYETQPWTQKHSPRCATEVLQTGREVFILKEWLQKLTVMSVETGGSDRNNSRASSISRRSAASSSEPSGKRKRKSKKLDGFVVSSDEEDNDMDEISEPEDDLSIRGRQNLLKKTVIRQGDVAAKDTKLTNAVVISGPHGCGKTAAVYAVAKELGFEIFEINSSSRRSGKDILERVGDMTRNHLIQQSHKPGPLDSVDEDAQRVPDALADDIKSGRQGTMNSFFKPTDMAKPKPKKSQHLTQTSVSDQASVIPKSQPKQQKQSLILFEEADVLYEEDKQFWSTVATLITQSKRPIIITCQDESLLPMQALSLHAILRFTPPPVDLATDYLLLVAANEGHALQRNAVKALYQSRHLDLRASLTELNFWCQFAVGDIKGGLDWLYPRWPLGCDVDAQGNTIRVVSERTYEAGMGWLSQDFLESHMHYLSIEEQTLHEAKDGWSMDLGHWQNSINMRGWANKRQSLSAGKFDDRACLRIYDEFADAMSVSDLFSGSAFAADDQIELDFTVPELSEKVREDYLANVPIIEATPLLNFDETGLNISLWMKSRARKHLQVDQHVKYGLEVASELDRPSEAHIVQLIESQISSPELLLNRQDLSLAFDPISEPEKTYVWSPDKLEASVFDRTQTIITTDLAPYVRSIVSYDVKLQQDRSRMSNLLSEGGRKGKRMRTTRAAFSALEGGARSTTRRDRYFGPNLNPYLVLKTGMPSWLEAVPSTSALNPGTSMGFSTGFSDLSKEDGEDGENH